MLHNIKTIYIYVLYIIYITYYKNEIQFIRTKYMKKIHNVEFKLSTREQNIQH